MISRCIILVLGCSSLWAGHVRDFTREFTVENHPSLTLDVAVGQIDIVRGSEGRIAIRVVQTLGDEHADDAEGVFDAWQFDFSQESNRVALHAGTRGNVVWDWDPVGQMNCRLEITAPEACDFEFVGHYLQITAGRVDGDLVARLDRGGLFAGQVSGNVSFKADGAQLTLSSVAGRADIDINSGQMLIGSSRGPVTVKSGGGTLEIQQASDSVKVRGETLDVIVGLANPLRNDCDVRTSAGNITLKVEQTAGLLIDAQAPWLGEIKVRDLDLVTQSGGVGKSRLVARLNDGGPRVQLRASGGTITLVGLEPLSSDFAAVVR